VVQNLLKNELPSALADGKLELKQAALAKFLKKKTNPYRFSAKDG
jgi:hypothetical protein